MRMLAMLTPSLLVAGCAATAPRGPLTAIDGVGHSHAMVGQPFVDFRFVDQDGRLGDLRQELGDFTILAFLSGDAVADQLAIDEMQAMLAASAADDNVRVVGVAIGLPGAAVEVRAPLGVTWFVADHTGAVHRAYRAESGNWLYVIGPERTVMLAAQAGRATELAGRFQAAVDALSEERVEAAYQGDERLV
jgi:peroxiredoxin